MPNSNQTTSSYPVGQQLAVLLVLLTLLFSSYLVPRITDQLVTERASGSDTSANVTAAATATPPAIADDSVPHISELDADIGATAAFVWDVNAQRALYKKAPDESLPLASITKLMTALVAYELVSGDKSIQISMADIMQSGSSGLLDGESFALADLTDMTLLSSSNDGAHAIASVVGAEITEDGNAQAFVKAMNIRAEELGLTQTHFRNPTGLDESASTPGAAGSARDVTFLLEYILLHHPTLLEATTAQTDRFYNQNGAFHNAENTNILVDDIPGLIGSKTGYTDLAGGNLTIAYDAGLNRPIIITVLGSSWRGRFNDVATLVDAIANQQ